MRWRSTGVRSLYLNIYLTVVAALLVFALVVVVLGLVIWRYAERIKAVRIDDAITGRNLGR